MSDIQLKCCQYSSESSDSSDSDVESANVLEFRPVALTSDEKEEILPQEDYKTPVSGPYIYPKSTWNYLKVHQKELSDRIQNVVEEEGGFAVFILSTESAVQKPKSVICDVVFSWPKKPVKILTFTTGKDHCDTKELKYNCSLKKKILDYVEKHITESIKGIHGHIPKTIWQSEEDFRQELGNLEYTAEKKFLPRSLLMDCRKQRAVTQSLLDMFDDYHEKVKPLEIIFKPEKANQEGQFVNTDASNKGNNSPNTSVTDDSRPTGEIGTQHTKDEKLSMVDYDKARPGSIPTEDAILIERRRRGEGETVGLERQSPMKDQQWNEEEPLSNFKNTSMTDDAKTPLESECTGEIRTKYTKDESSSMTDDDKARPGRIPAEEAMLRGKRETVGLERQSPMKDQQWNEEKAYSFYNGLDRWGPVRDQPWNEKEIKKIRQDLQTTDPMMMKKNLKILLFGPTGQGKSSLGNSFLSALRNDDNLSNTFPVGSSNKTTARFHATKVLGESWLIDMPGIFETKAITDVRVEDIASGKIPFYAEITNNLEVKGIQTNPRPGENDVSCVVIVLNYDQEFGEEVRRQIDVIIKLAGKGVISYQIVLTHLDECDTQFKDSERLPDMYKSDKVQMAVKRMAQEAGVAPYCISFVKNYVHETEKHPNTTLLHLRVLKKIVSSACDQAQKRKDMASLKETYHPGFFSTYRLYIIIAASVVLALLAIYLAK